MGLLQGTISPAIWPSFVSFTMAKAIWDALKMRFGKVGGAQTYLQLVNMITMKMTNLENLLTQIQEFWENYTRILTNGHSTFSKDLITFTFCSTLPSLYKETACQYFDNIGDIAKYKLLDIIAQVLQEKGKHPQKGKGQQTPKVSTSLGNKKKMGYKGKGKAKAKESLNVLSIVELLEVNMFSSKSIDFSCYVKGEVVE